MTNQKIFGHDAWLLWEYDTSKIPYTYQLKCIASSEISAKDRKKDLEWEYAHSSYRHHMKVHVEERVMDHLYGEKALKELEKLQPK